MSWKITKRPEKKRKFRKQHENVGRDVECKNGYLYVRPSRYQVHLE